MRYTATSVANNTYTASKDTYVDIGTDGTVDYNEVANGAASPALSASHIRVAKVVTNGSAITSVVQAGADSLSNPIKPNISINRYKFFAYRSGAWTTANGSYGKVSLNAELYDTNGDFDSSTNYRYNVPVDGYYHFDFGVGGSVGSGSFFASFLYRNGGGYSLGSAAVSSNTFTHVSHGSADIFLNAGDYIELYFRGSGGAGDAGNTSTFLCGHLISVS